MPNLILSTRALKVVNKAIDLFHHDGFPIVGVDKIMREAGVAKMTFYNYFHSKERFIEICLIVQKERLKEKVISIAEEANRTDVIEQLKKLYFLHTDLEGPYYLLFKAIFETKLAYPKAYQVAVRYRTWLINEIYSQLIKLKADASFHDAKLFLYMIEGTIIQLLSSDEANEKDRELEWRWIMKLLRLN
ncbi:TetR/AcrR family transcriptional regulator [Acinetobacter sp. 161(2023)]|uniref:TetR/AcrR family transcriptional regulator n=1 Tax=Acinetobacter sp. 161(2023) TaxID=3098768 RepID=UPI003008D068